MSMALATQVLVPLAAGGGNEIHLSDKFKQFWNTLIGASGFGPIINLLGVIGVVLVVFALIKWAWDRRRGGGGGNTSAIWGALFVGAILSLPGTILPILLTFLDVVVNAVLKIWNSPGIGG